MFKIPIKEPYKTALILGVTISVFVGGAYLILSKDKRDKMNAFIKSKLKFKKKDETEVGKDTIIR